MFAIRMAATACLMLLTAASPSFGADKDVLLKLYNGMAAAIASHDVDAYMSYYHPSAISVDDKGGRRTVEQVRAVSIEFFTKTRNFRSVVEFASILNDGAKMTVQARKAAVLEMTADGRKWMAVAAAELSEDVWEKRGGQWKLTYTKTVLAKVEPIQANSGAQAANPAQRQQQAAPSAQENNHGAKKAMYDSCVAHCQSMSMNCSMGSGNYFGGNSYNTGRPCISDQQGCVMRCGLH
jgi:ketosteroid isomerase-like protein